MNDLILVFRMEEISRETRANIIVKLGRLINDQYGSNITEPIVYELLLALGVNHEVFNDESFLLMARGR